MRPRFLALAFGILLCGTPCLHPQPQPAASPEPAIRTYIHEGWDKLSRSMTECASLADPKLTTEPVLYLPAEQKMPASVRALQSHCNVDVRHLPRRIRHEGDLMPGDINTPGLLYLPHRYVVPGGRFNEMYGWDSYFILLGEISDHRLSLARGTVENFFYEIDHYGSILNANRTYFLTRSQPPFLSSMVLEIYHAEEQTDPAAARNWLQQALPYLLRDHALWSTAPHLAGSTGLSRYVDLGHGPVPEMADDSSYYVDVIHWLRAHPEAAPPEYLERVPQDTSKSANGGSSQCAQARASNCLQTEAEGWQLTESFFAGDRAMRESGFDTTFRFGPFSGSTQQFAPVCLNALLYKYERDLAFITATLGDREAAVNWSSTAGQRLARMNELLWDDAAGTWLDYNFLTHRRSTYQYLTSFYTLWAGVASPQQAQRMLATLPDFERAGGLRQSTATTGEQWDAPFGWAPENWLAIDGLERYGFHNDAARLARKFSATVEHGFATDGTLREKYNMESASSDVAVTTGYKQNVIGFGWTNGVYLRLQTLLASAGGQK